MITLKKGRLKNYTKNEKPPYSAIIDHVDTEVINRSKVAFQCVIESKNGTVLSKELIQTDLSLRIFLADGTDVTDILERGNLSIRWEAIESEFGQSRSSILGSSFRLKYLIAPSIVQSDIRAYFSEEEALRILLPSSPIPGATHYPSNYINNLLQFKNSKNISSKITLSRDYWIELNRTNNKVSLVDEQTSKLKTTTLANKREVLLSLISLDVIEVEGSMIFRNNEGRVTLEARIKFGEEDITEELRERGISLEWLRKNPQGVDENGQSDNDWIEAHRGRYQVTFTPSDNVGRAEIGCRIVNKEVIERWLEEHHLTNI